MVFGRVKAVTAMVCAALISTPLIALADDGPITSQPYVDFYGIHKAHEQGYAGQGATIAIIDGIIDPSVPELEGADIEVVAECNTSETRVKKGAHATAIASFLVSPAYGWVPKAKLIAYATNTVADEDLGKKRDDDLTSCTYDTSWAIADAIERKVDIISISLEPFHSDTEWQALIHEAAQQGIIVVLASGNSGFENSRRNNSYNSAVSVGSHNLDGQRSTFSTYGEGLTLLAIGEPFTIREADDNGRLTRVITNAQGTSFSTPMVAGALALGKSKWPKATNNQILRAMLDTAIPCLNDPERRACGYGMVNIGAFAKSDPLSKEDSNPLMEKSRYGLEVLQKGLTEFNNGLYVDYGNYHKYIYRGTLMSCSDYPQETNPQSRCQPGSSPIFMKNLETYEKENNLNPTPAQ